MPKSPQYFESSHLLAEEFYEGSFLLKTGWQQFDLIEGLRDPQSG